MKITHFILQSEIKDFEQGMSLVAVIVITTLFTSLIMVMATQQWANSNMNALVANEQKAYYVAEAGIEYAIRRSIDNDNWNWSLSGAFADGNVSLNVAALGEDSIRIISTGQVGISAKRNVQILNVIDLTYYCVFIAGSIWGWFYTPDWDKVRTNVTDLPTMNIDSMRSVSQSQGRYHSGNYTVNHIITPWSFWSNPGNHNQDANIIFVEGNLTFPWYNLISRGIYVVNGNVKFAGINQVLGVVYLPNSTSTSQVSSNLLTLLPTVYGGIFGNSHIIGAFFGTIRVFSNMAHVTKFYTYAQNENFLQIKRLVWTSVY